jgi:hypothetical protein
MQMTRRFHGALLGALLALVPFTFAGAQSLTPGTRVRVKSSQVVVPVIGSYQGMRRDTVVVIEDGVGAQVWTFAAGAVDRIEISAGMKGGNRRPTTRWALIGGGTGLVAGALAAAALESNTADNYNVPLSALVGAAVGGGLGAAYGYRKLEERWTRVTIPRRVGLAPTAHGVRLAFNAGF